MYYIIRRKGNIFSKKVFESIFGEGSIDKAIKNKHVKKLSNNYYKGINNEEPRQWRRIPDLYNRSGARRFINETTDKPMSLRRAKELNIDIAMAISSGFVLQTDKGLVYDRGQYRPVYPQSTTFDRSDKVIARVGNYYPEYLVNKLAIDKTLLKYNPNTGLYEGLVNDNLSKIVTFENSSLIGIPYIMLDQLYSGKISSFEITEDNIIYIMEMIISGHVFTVGNKVYLDNKDIKRHKFYNWVGKVIYNMAWLFIFSII